MILVIIIMIIMINVMMMESYVDYGQGGGYGDDIMMLIINSLLRHCLLTAVLKFEQNWWNALKHSSIRKVFESSQKNSAKSA